MEKWKIISDKYLFQNPPWLTIREDKLLMPDGGIMDSYYVFEYPDWVSVIAIDTLGQMIMIKQYRHALGVVAYELSAGISDDTDPNTLYSAQRELLEETGYGGGKWSYWMKNSANPGTHTNYTHCYLAIDVHPIQDQTLDKTEDIEVHVLDQKEVYQLLLNNEFHQSLHAAPLWKYFAMHKPQ
ncbi:MAG: ADP-ribose pyrophosphatase [Saprospiraceae bacterium]|jgi:ADP-ribose pyrophosphatase